MSAKGAKPARKSAPQTLNNLTLIGDPMADSPLYRCYCGIQKAIPRVNLRNRPKSCGCLLYASQKRAKPGSMRPVPWYLPNHKTQLG